LKQNSTATEGCSLFLTKPIGVGIFTTAQKRGIVKPEDFDQALQTMLTLNKPGETFGKLSYVKAMTDVTGFGLLGHLGEMVDGSNLSAEIEFSKVPKLTNIDFYISQGSMPGGTKRNWESYGNGIEGVDEYKRSILCDPQTSGGLLVAIEQGNENEFISVAESIGLRLECFGKLVKRGDARILVR